MNCDRLAQWLDAGMPAPESERALAHARECARCARALDAARSLDAALAAGAPPPPALPADFTERVMARLEPARGGALAPLTLPALAVRLARDPAFVLGVALAALVIMQRAAIESAVRVGYEGASAAAASLGAAASGLATAMAQPAWITATRNVTGGEWALVTLALSLVLPASWWLFHSSQHWFAPRASAAPRHTRARLTGP